MVDQNKNKRVIFSHFLLLKHPEFFMLFNVPQNTQK